MTFLTQKTHLCGCVAMGKRKREKKIHFFRFLLVSSYHPGWIIIRLVQKKAKIPTSVRDFADPCPVRMSLQHPGIFFAECGKSLSCLFLFYKENLYWTPEGVSVNDQGFYSIFYVSVSEGASLYIYSYFLAIRT